MIPLPVLAVEFGQVVGLIILVLSVLSWFVNLVKGKDGNPPAAGPRRPQPRRDERVRQEIEVFLQEVLKQKPSEKEATRAPRPRPPKEAAHRPKAPQQPKKVKSPKPPRRTPTEAAAPLFPASDPVSERVVSSLASQHLRESSLGSTVRGQSLSPQSASSHVVIATSSLVPGAAAVGQGLTDSTALKAEALRGLLQQPAAIQQAILLQEVLGKPVALRSKSR